MFESPEIMEKIKFVLSFNTKLMDVLKFLEEKGRFIKKLSIQNSFESLYSSTYNANDQHLIPLLMSHTPNLVDFSCERQLGIFDENKPFPLSHLRHLSLTNQVFNFLTNAQNIENLESLNLSCIRFEHEILVNFLCK